MIRDGSPGAATASPSSVSASGGDPLSGLLGADSPEGCLELLPAAVARAGELAEQLCRVIELRRGSSDPVIVELVAAVEAALVAHERFVDVWSDVTELGAISQGFLDDDVCTLINTWAGVLRVVLDRTEGPSAAGSAAHGAPDHRACQNGGSSS